MCNYRLFDRYGRPVVSLAVLGDDRPSWRPDQFGYELWGCRVGIRFPIVKLLDYAVQSEHSQVSRNPFGVVVQAHLKARETAHDTQGRYRGKLGLVKQLYERGFGREDVLHLFRFIDWVLALPAGLDRQFLSKLQE